MNFVEELQLSFFQFLQHHFNLNSNQVASRNLLTLNTDEKKQAFGDLNSNAAMVFAKELKQQPIDLAHAIEQKFKHKAVEKIEIAGPGFLNFTLTQNAWHQIIQEVLKQRQQYFKPPALYQSAKINIEFVSANPTGPLHIGHGRSGIIGDVLANILSFLGNDVTREFYINDAGAQITKLGISLKIRCQQILKQDVALPEDAYHGDYLVDLAHQCLEEQGKSVIEQPESFFADYAKKYLLEQIKKTLHDYGIEFDVWMSEKTLHEKAITQALEQLKADNLLYEEDGAWWFRATSFGDDKDRVVRKATGELTYVAADIAYLKDKVSRGFKELIIILGHDHHGYALRLQAALSALGLSIQTTLDVILYQLVTISSGGQLVRMSKRTGTMVTLNDIIKAVGTDVARFFFLNRKADVSLEFDLELALNKTEENPVYYIQYAYVRTGSIAQKATAIIQEMTDQAPVTPHYSDDDRYLVRKIISLQPLLVDIATSRQTHLLTYYLLELAQIFNRYYAKHRVINNEDKNLTYHRLALTAATRCTLETGLLLLGLSQPERM